MLLRKSYTDLLLLLFDRPLLLLLLLLPVTLAAADKNPFLQTAFFFQSTAQNIVTITMACCDKRASFALLLSAFHCLLHGASAVTYDVSASGGGLDLAEAMALAEAGDIVSLADGTYDAAIVSHRDGEEGSPITVEGGPGAIINGDYNSRSVLIKHSFITLKVLM